MALKKTIMEWSLPTLSIFLGFFFFFSGILKVSPSINRDIHREIRRNFVQYAKFIPFSKELNLKIPPSTYRLTVGYTEVVCGLVLAFVSGSFKQFVNLFLVLFMLGAIYTHHVIGDSIEKMYPAMLVTVLLLTRYAVYIVQRRNHIKMLVERQEKTAKTSEPKLTKSQSASQSDSSEKSSKVTKEKATTSSKTKKKASKKAKKVKEN